MRSLDEQLLELLSYPGPRDHLWRDAVYALASLRLTEATDPPLHATRTRSADDTSPDRTTSPSSPTRRAR